MAEQRIEILRDRVAELEAALKFSLDAMKLQSLRDMSDLPMRDGWLNAIDHIEAILQQTGGNEK